MVDNYGELWQFKPCVASWTFGVSRFKDYVYLRHREFDSGIFVNWNINEKVALIENPHTDYIVIVLQAVDSEGINLPHIHSIVLHSDQNHGLFDLENLCTFLQGTSMDSLSEDFIK